MLPALEVFTIFNVDYEGKNLAGFPIRKVKSAIFLTLIIVSAMMTFSILPRVNAETTIISLDPAVGYVNSTVHLKGNITTPNGLYKILWDNTTALLSPRNATGNEVNVTFPIPETVEGFHSVMLVDVTANQNVTRSFTVIPAYYMTVDVPEPPKQLQEGNSVPIAVNMTGVSGSKAYVVNITVLTPGNLKCQKLMNVTTSDVGSNSTAVVFPDNFTEAKTNFTGTYAVFFNTSLARYNFSMGLTSSLEYHRNQTVDIQALYRPSENVNITITGNNVRSSENVTADNSTGLVHYTNWFVPENASMGTYTVSIVSASTSPTIKNPPDTQSFTVPGYSVNITALNLAGEIVPNVLVKMLENETSVAEGLTDSGGLAHLRLEIGNYTGQAHYKDTKVGENPLVVIANDSLLNLKCNLTNIRVAVADEAANDLPEVEVLLISSVDNQTLFTDINGTVIAHSILPNVTYTMNFSRYDMPFNSTTIPLLPTTAWYDLAITCPTMTLNVSVTNAKGQPLEGSLVKAQELLGGRYYEGNTVNGLVSLNCPFGKYTVSVYVSGTKVNETIVSLNETTVDLPINCGLYGLSVSIRIVDYFGQGIPNANVTWQRSGLEGSSIAGADGKVSFSNVIGGDLQVTVRLSGQSDPCVIARTYVDAAVESVEVRIDKYIVLFGMLVETSRLVAAIIIVLSLMLILSLEIVRRQRFKSQKSEG